MAQSSARLVRDPHTPILDAIHDFRYFQRGPSQPAETNFVCNLNGPGFPERVRNRLRQQ